MSGSIVILLGAPGAGKGTQAKRLSDSTGLVHVSTGDLFRENQAKGTPLGLEAKGYMEKGQLVPDDLVLRMLFDRVSRPDTRQGYVLDGFPRTEPQAEALTKALSKMSGQQGAQKPLVVQLDLPDDQIVERAAGRLICASCGNIQHLKFSPPKRAGVCDACGGELRQRKDDQPEVVRERLAVYHRQTAPLVAYYERQGVLSNIDGSAEPDAVFEQLVELVRPSLVRGEG